MASNLKTRLLKHLEENFRYCKEFTASLCGFDDPTCIDVVEAKPTVLPLMVARHMTDKTRALLERRLKGEDMDWPAELLNQLWNMEHEMDVYRKLGQNDGNLYAIADVYRLLKLYDESHDVLKWVYDPDLAR